MKLTKKDDFGNAELSEDGKIQFEKIEENDSICCECGEKTNDDGQTKWDKNANPFCSNDCLNNFNK